MSRCRALVAVAVAGSVLAPCAAGAATAAERPAVRGLASAAPAPSVGQMSQRLSAAMATGGAARTASAATGTGLEVRLRPGTSGERALALARAAGTVRSATADGFAVQLPSGDAAPALRALDASPDVLEVTPVRERRFSYVPTDVAWAQQPYLETIGLPEAWERTRGSADVRIAVVDSGVDVAHPDLRLPDGRSKVVATYNAVTGGTDVRDTVGHGTFVAGVAAAVTDNGEGVAGAGFSSSLLAVKVDDSSGRIWSTAVAAGVRWAADRGADVINISLGSPGLSGAEQDAVAYARSRGAVVVAAAGNEGSTTPSYPAALPGVLAVGATDGDRRAAFSNHGSWVDVGAPGVGIRSTSPRAGSSLYDPGYDDSAGTSFAAPLVAGEVALLAAVHPGASESSLVSAVLRGTSGAYGFAAGRVHVPTALASLTPVAPVEPVEPVAPQTVRITDAVPARFSPNGDRRSDTTVLTYVTSLPGELALTVTGPQGAVHGPRALGVRPAGTGTVSWDGRRPDGSVVADGAYTAQLELVTDDGTTSVSAGAAVVVDRTPPALSALTGSAAVFYPVRDGYGDTFSPTMVVAEPLSALELRVHDSVGRLVRVVKSGPRPAGRVSLTWDGRRSDGSAAPAGGYRFSFRAVDAAQNERSTALYGVTVSGKKLVGRTATRTVTPAQSREGLLIGSCSTIRTPATGTGWSGSYEHLSAYYRGCYAPTDDLAASVHRFTLPPAVRYGNVNVSTYGKSYPGYADLGVVLYHDRTGRPTDVGRVLPARAGQHPSTSVPVSAWVDGSRTFRWSVGTTDMNWYQVRSFTITWSYFVLA